jgi:hypothetical protein
VSSGALASARALRCIGAQRHSAQPRCVQSRRKLCAVAMRAVCAVALHAARSRALCQWRRRTVPALGTSTLAERLVARRHGPKRRVGAGSSPPVVCGTCMMPKSMSRPEMTSTETYMCVASSTRSSTCQRGQVAATEVGGAPPPRRAAHAARNAAAQHETGEERNERVRACARCANVCACVRVRHVYVCEVVGSGSSDLLVARRDLELSQVKSSQVK